MSNASTTRMPPLQGLYYFYQAAHLGSFKAAANELFVTAAAISQQIRLLEEWLDTPLFYRQHRKVTLTPEGEILFSHAQQGFRSILNGVWLLNNDPAPHQLSLSTVPSFSQNWLVPRLAKFRASYPDLSIMLESTTTLNTFEQSSIDLCIRYGGGHYDGLHSEWLMGDILYPVCHPLYQQQEGIYTLEDLPKGHLISDMWRDMDWTRWLNTVGIAGGSSTITYNGSNYAIEGALSLQGIVLARHSLVQRYIADGTLVRIGGAAVKPTNGYFLCAPAGYFKRDKVDQFCCWIKQQADEFKATWPREITLYNDTHAVTQREH
ncbi:transcriptional regulator [Salinivibrio sp. PR6]|uniref:LysR substrate-binding domain-containing protein n=1 Tax=Salinivibrio sp. PR6 TaxID=1909485 RepID=UPI000988F3FF|nr:LysR substrate-binding domain-containing protein [Salinivibrio sp. PR6]OOE84348.1 transcriptional regulator [Salinivibrio sp. PR6]